MKYMSKEWYQALQEKTNSDREYLKKTRRLTLKFQIMATDAPGGVDKLSTWDVERGKIKFINVEEKPAPSDWRTMQVDLKKYAMRGIGPYEVHCGIHRQEFVPFTEVLTKGFTVQGDMTKLMSTMLAEFVALVEYQANVPAEY